jgi:hypothetical protein
VVVLSPPEGTESIVPAPMVLSRLLRTDYTQRKRYMHPPGIVNLLPVHTISR